MNIWASSIASTVVSQFFLETWEKWLSCSQSMTKIFILDFEDIVFFLLHFNMNTKMISWNLVCNLESKVIADYSYYWTQKSGQKITLILAWWCIRWWRFCWPDNFFSSSSSSVILFLWFCISICIAHIVSWLKFCKNGTITPVKTVSRAGCGLGNVRSDQFWVGSDSSRPN